MFSTSKYSSEVAGLEARCQMPDAVDAAMDSDQTSALESPGDLFACKAGFEELDPRHDAMRALGNSGDQPFRRIRPAP
jgi:hypothetical protein